MLQQTPTELPSRRCLNGFQIQFIFASLFLISGNILASTVDPDFEEGFCAPYTGKVCRSFIRSSQVWFSRVDPNYGWENEKITAGLWEEMIAGLSGLCRNAAEVNCFKSPLDTCTLHRILISPLQKLLCAYAFPQCIIKDGTTLKLPLCYEDCVATHSQFCYNDWALIEDRKQKDIFFKTRGHFRLPVCDELPRYNRSARPATCSYVGLTEMEPDEITCEYCLHLSCVAKIKINSIESARNQNTRFVFSMLNSIIRLKVQVKLIVICVQTTVAWATAATISEQ